MMISGSFNSQASDSTGTLSFKVGDSAAPLVFAFDFSGSTNILKMYGMTNTLQPNGYVQEAFTNIADSGSFTIKMSTQSGSSNYIVEYTDSNTDSAFLFDYNKNWATFQSSPYTFQEVTKITLAGSRASIGYINVCKSVKPVICDNSQSSTVPTYSLQQSIQLACSAYGLSPLTASWSTGSTVTTATTAALATQNDAVNSQYGNKITSTLTINSLTLDHLATYTCTVYSDKGQITATDTQENTVSFTEALGAKPFSAQQQSYFGQQLNQQFTFTVTGWPLENLNVIVPDSSFTENFDLKYNELFSQVPPTMEMIVTFPNPIPEDSIVFNVVQTSSSGGSDTVLRTITVHKVGAKCGAGQYGSGLDCLECGREKTSAAGSDSIEDCAKLQSGCSAGYYGILEDCTRCPDGLTSNPETLFREDCFAGPNTDEVKDDDEDDDPKDTMTATYIVLAIAIVGFIVVIILISIAVVKAKQKEKKKAKEGTLKQSDPGPEYATADKIPEEPDNYVQLDRNAFNESKKRRRDKERLEARKSAQAKDRYGGEEPQYADLTHSGGLS